MDVVEVNGRKIIIDGHHRARAAGGVKLDQVPIRIHEVDPATAAKYEQQAAEAAHALGLSNRW
ncbi:ParB N-terminal domain-containing protein [Gynuella sunshinyii]|uniref:ParB N-terminal domain-containing protein n=1 Tax=Gynuella sunshinyii TaxID=1445505 RepID=UPI0009E57859